MSPRGINAVFLHHIAWITIALFYNEYVTNSLDMRFQVVCKLTNRQLKARERNGRELQNGEKSLLDSLTGKNMRKDLEK